MKNFSFLWNPIEQSLSKYRLVRKSVYFERRGWTHDFSLPDRYDRCSHILVVMDGNQCIGGARLTVKSEIGSMFLPTESECFRFDAIFPHLNLQDTEYAEVSRQVLLREYRGGSTVSLLDRCIVERCKHLGVPVVFADFPLDNAVRTKKAYSKLIRQVTIHKDICIPSSSMYDNCQLYLGVFEL